MKQILLQSDIGMLLVSEQLWIYFMTLILSMFICTIGLQSK